MVHKVLFNYEILEGLGSVPSGSIMMVPILSQQLTFSSPRILDK